MSKEIYFCKDNESLNYIVQKLFDSGKANLHNSWICEYYDVTEQALNSHCDYIITSSLAHLSFDLINDGYDIYLCCKGKEVKIEPHMDLTGIGEPCKDLRFGHNIFKLFRAGIFDNLFE